MKSFRAQSFLRGMAVFLLAAGAWTTATAQHTLSNFNDPNKRVSYTIRSAFGSLPPGGYLPVIVEAQNKESEPYTLRFSFSSSYSYRSNNDFKSSFSLTVEAGKDAKATFLVPLITDVTNRSGYYGGGSSLSVQVSASGLAGDRGHMGSEMDPNYPSVALSTESARLDWQSVRNSSSTGHHRSGNFGAKFDPKDLPANWMGYTGFDSLVIKSNEWSMVTASARKSVLDWVRQGGTLMVWNDPDAPSYSQLGLDDDPDCYGLGEVILKGGGNKSVSRSDLVQFQSVSSQLSEDYTHSWPIQGEMGIRSFKTGQIVFILLIFAILVGPVNLFVFAKSGKRHRLFFTTPAISIGASLILAGLIVIQDGFGGDGMRNTFTVIDSENNQAITVQEQLARTGVLMSRSFETDEPLLVQPVVMNESRWTFVHNGYNAGTANYSQGGKSMSGDFFRSRSEQGHQIKAVTPTRESVEQSGLDNGMPTVISSMAHPLARLVYKDPAGKIWQAENVKTGEKVTLKPWSDSAARNWWNQTLRFSGKSLRERADVLMRGNRGKGCFFAEATGTEDSPFSIATLESIDWQKSHSVIFGKMKNAMTPAPESQP